MADALEEAKAAGGLKATLKDLFSGAVGGVAQVLIGTWSWSLAGGRWRWPPVPPSPHGYPISVPRLPPCCLGPS